MAEHRISVFYLNDGEMETLSVTPPPELDAVVDTDSIKVANVSASDGTISITAYSSNFFDIPTSTTCPVGSTRTRTIKDGALGSSYINISAGSKSVSVPFTVVSNVDSTPDSFTFTDVTIANPNQEFYSNVINVSGINTSIQATISGNGAVFSVNGGSYNTSAKTVSNGDNITVRMNASGSYNTTVSTTLSMGGVSDTWSVKTRVAPDTGQKIHIPVTSLPIKRSDVINFFGGTGAPTNLGSYYRGSIYVPNIVENNSIGNTANTLKLSTFVNSATSFYFETLPPNMGDSLNNSSGGTNTLYDSKSAGVHFDFGYSANMANILQYRMEFTSQNVSGDGGSGSDVTFTSGGSASSYSTNNKHIQLQVTVTGATERIYTGWVKLYARHPQDTGVVITADLHYRFNFFGV